MLDTPERPAALPELAELGRIAANVSPSMLTTLRAGLRSLLDLARISAGR